MHQFREHWISDSHTLLKGVNEWVLILFIFLACLGKIVRYKRSPDNDIEHL
jgi:membrane protein YqaA with SNARE-associated domain